ncbi:MAG: FAD-dependent oxidoreductase [Rhodoglobus sp.]
MKNWLDRRLGAIATHKIVIVALVLLAGVAIVLALFGLISANPAALLASLPVAIAFSWGASWLAATIARAHAHLESSLITGLLVFFIMAPSFDVGGLLGIGLAATIAGASKYLIVFRGRHIFNPAALGAYVFIFVPLGFPTWWIGTPLLQPLILVGAAIILYRSHRLDTGLVFVVVAASIRIAVTVAAGGTLTEALTFTFASSPLIFFVGFMLSEPLTQPPRRWQRLGVAVLVAALFAIPFSVGPLYSDPLLALLIGNLVSFAFTQRRTIRMTLTETQHIAENIWQVTFAVSRGLTFRAGQYVELSLPHASADFRGVRRYFTISSPPDFGATLSVTFSVSERSSSFKAALLSLPRGSAVNATGIWGDFVLPRNTDHPLLLIAGGIGITPFASQLGHAQHSGQRRNTVLAYATTRGGDFPFADVLDQSGARIIAFGPSQGTTVPPGWESGGTARINGETLSALVPDLARRRIYISGPPAFVNELKRALRKHGAKTIRTDHFSGY